MADEVLIAVFIDYENLALGERDMKKSTVEIDLVLKRFLEKRYNISVPDEEASAEAFDSVASIVSLVKRHQGGA